MRNREILFIIKLRNEARRALASLRGDLTRSAAGAKTASDNIRKTQQNLGALNALGVSSAGIFSRLGSILGGIGLGLGLAQGVRTLADFSQAMSTVQAITQATDEQFQELSETARDLGATTRFTATQAAEGMVFLARAGFDTNQVLESVDDTLLLAQAGALGLGRAADIASNILTGFRLETSEAGRVVDVLAFAANNANTNVEQLGDAMKFVAPVASGLGVSIEEAAAAVAALSDAGLQGSLAGTGLRRVLSELESPSIKTRQILRALGVTADEVRVSQVGLTQALQRLADAGVDTGTALEIFGDRGGPAFEVLSSSIPKVVEMTQKLGDAEGTARRIATVMDDNLNGALLRVRSALEAVVLQLGEVGGTSFLTGILDGIASAFRAVANNADVLANIIVGLVASVAARFVPGILAGTAALFGFGTAAGVSATALARLRLVLRGLGIGLLIQAVTDAIQLFRDWNKEIVEGVTTWDLFGAAAIGVLKTIGEALGSVLRSVGLFGTALGRLVAGQFSEAVAAAREGGEEFASAFGVSFSDNIKRELSRIKPAVQEGVQGAALNTAEVTDALFGDVDFGDAGDQSGKTFTNAFFEAIKEFGGFNNFTQALDQVVSKFAPAIQKQKEQAEALKILDVAAKASAEQLRDLGLTQAQLAEITDKVRAGIEQETGAVAKAVREAEKRISILQTERAERDIERTVIEAVNRAKEEGERLDQTQIALLRERLRLARDLQVQEEINRNLESLERRITLQVQLVGVTEDAARRTRALEVLRSQAAQNGVALTQRQIDKVNELFDTLERREAEQRGDILGGARQGVQDFIRDMSDLNSQFRDFSEGALRGLSDAITDFATTGKFNFRDFADNAIRELQRIASNQIVSALASSLFAGPAGAAGAGGGAAGFGGLLASLFHSGGVVGKDGVKTVASAAAFAGAQRFHMGGRVGGSGDTVPILASPGEVVLTEDQAADLRRVLSVRAVGGISQPGAAAQQASGGDRVVIQAPITVVSPNPESFMGRETQGQIAAATARSMSKAARRNN